MSTEADIVTPEKLRAMVASDHKRGCQGREYGCSCGYDDDKDAMIERAAVALEQLRAELEDAYIESRNRQNMGAKEARDMRERCAGVADAMTKKWGKPNGDAYEQGAQDQGIRISHQIGLLPDTPAVIATKEKTS